MEKSPAAPLLLVDDEPANLLALEAVLQVLGEPLVRASSGQAALRELRDNDFAAVLLDVRMPGMDGFEAARLIRAQRRSRTTPIIFITADASDIAVEEAYALGAVDFLAKPLKPAVLKAKLAFFIELHRNRNALYEAQAAREAAAAEQIRREEAEAAAALIQESQDRLIASQERVRLATDAARLGVWVWDAQGDRLGWENERLFSIFGVQPGEQPLEAQKFIDEFMHPQDAEAFEQAMAFTACIGTRLHFEGRCLRRDDGSQRWIEFTGVLQGGEEGAPSRILGTAADITERKHAEEDLRRLATELAETDRRKTEFLATLAHELRNPLAPISNGLQLMRFAGGNPEAQHKARDMMERQLRHMVHLVDDLLDIARISSNKVELRVERLDLAGVIASAVETSTPLVTTGGHTLDLRVPPEPLQVDGDVTRLAQVLSNLLNNAAKYTPHGGRIELQAAREGDEAVISVSDTGVGIAPEGLADVFEMFTQVGRNRDRSQGGLGIGLALVKRLVELHGGDVEAESGGPGQGSRFTVRLPLAEVSEGDEAVAAPSNEAHEPLASLRVLVVDDNADAADSLATLLEFEGHATRVAHEANEALQTAEEFRPDIVFLDIGMPGKDGYEVARELRRSPIVRNAVLVALTGWGAEEDRMRTRKAGFDHHLTKPAGLESVDALLERIGREKKARQASEPPPPEATGEPRPQAAGAAAT